jgi:lipoprotein LprG
VTGNGSTAFTRPGARGPYDARMILRRPLLGALTLLAVLVAGCSSNSSPAALPDAAGLLSGAATATGAMRSAHFTLQTNGAVKGLSVQNLEGDLTKDGGPKGAAKGSGKLDLMGQLVEVEFVLAEDTLYVKGPTGGFQKIPAALGASIYDPSAVLDPGRGISKVLAGVANPRTEAEEEVNGTRTYRVTGKVARDVLAGLIPGVQSDADTTFWLRAEGNHAPVKASAALPGGTVDVTLSDVDKPVTVTPPA